jgi:hypothetical protein
LKLKQIKLKRVQVLQIILYAGKVGKVFGPELLPHKFFCDISHPTWATAVNCVVVKQLTTKLLTIRK